MVNAFWKSVIIILCLIASNKETYIYGNGGDTTPASTERHLYTIIGKTALVDPYLSPLSYKGYSIKLGSEWGKLFKKNTRFSQQGYIQLGYMTSINASRTNKIYGININAGWGTAYNWRLLNDRICLSIGPFLNFDYLGKLHIKNVNKPYSMDIGLDIGNAVSASFSTYLNKKRGHTIRIKYDFFNNGMGIGYSPEYWQSYYEITEGIKGKMACTGWWNRIYLKHRFVVDFQINKFKFRLGIEHHYLKYNYSSLENTRQNFSFIVGYILNYKLLHERFFDK